MEQEEQDRIFSEWLKSHKGLFFKIIRSYAFTPQDQEDLFQDIATQVWRSIPNFRGDSAVTTWIYRVGLNCAIAWTRKEQKHRVGKQGLDGVGPVLVENPRHEDDTQLAWLYEQIGQLNEIDRSLTLLLLDDFSYSEMASALGISEGNVRVKISRIRAHLAKVAKRGNGNGN